MKKNLAYSNLSSLNYYKNNRTKLIHLYDSEKNFFKNSVIKSHSFLDFGCGIGNFVNIINEIKKGNYQYTGLDSNKKLINIAKKKYPKYNFRTIYNQKFSKNNKYDFVFSLGTLHHIKNWEQCIISLKKLTIKNLLFDVRLTEYKTINSINQFQKIVFNTKWDGKSKMRYITLNKYEFFKFMKKNFKNYNIKIKNYYHPVGRGYVGIHKNVLMTSVLCIKK